ncbi:MAG: ATP-binding cassette domain-containing protein [Candidatus Promineifilaceae bacterium]|jgi:ABC-2 type transport system ATP-binding protein
MSAIRCEGLTRFYGKVEALKDLDLEIEAGSVFGFLGRNGAGKTTTIRLLTGLARPTSGSGWVDGVMATAGDAGAREKFGYLPEEPAFYTWMNPAEYLDYVGKIFGMSADQRRERTGELLGLTGLAEVKKRRIGGFSRGMRQRLGLAQALMHRPPVLFLDEPTSALDPAGRRDVLDFIDTLRGQTTVFLSSHILADVERVCDTIGVIHEGELLLVEDRDRLLAKYASNVAVLTFDRASLPVPEALVADLRGQSWATAVTIEGDSLRLSVNDMGRAKAALLQLVASYHVILDRYEWIRPTLEDVFLTISA